MVVYSSTAVRASVNNNQIGGLSNNPDATLIEKNQNRFEFGPQTLSLELPDAGSVSAAFPVFWVIFRGLLLLRRPGAGHDAVRIPVDDVHLYECHFD